MAENAERNLRLFRELITCTRNLYSWTYDVHFSLVYSNCPDADLMGMLFISMTDNIPPDVDAPMLLSSEFGLSWAVNLERDGSGLPLYYHVIGPAVASKFSIAKAKQAIFNRSDVSDSLVGVLDGLLAKIPSVPISRILEYCIMLHYCVTEEKLSISDILYPGPGAVPREEQDGHTANPHGTWLMEQRLLKLVEDGNLNFRQEKTRLVSGLVPADLGGGDGMRHLKNLVIAFISCCTRAAIRGGLSPETAYLLSDRYIRGVEACAVIADLVELNDSMQEDFIRRVHQSKSDGLSPQIRQCCDYIQIHVEDELSLTSISAAIGYSPTWLSGKFKKEMGISLTQYISQQRMERAKELLRSGNRPIQDIAEALHYKTPSHFGTVFRQYTGISPSEYRMERGKVT